MTIIAAFPHGKRDRSALHLSAFIARSYDEDLRIVSVVPEAGRGSIPSGSDLQFAAWAKKRSRQAVREAEAAAAQICPDLTTVAVAVENRSRAKGLLAEAAAHRATMIVLGSGTEGTRGRIRVSATSDRLLHSSPVPVALAPKGFVAPERLTRVTCSFRPDLEARAVLAATAEFAHATCGRLRIATFGVSGRTVPPESVEEESARRSLVAELRTAQVEAIDSLDGAEHGEAAAGEPIAEAVGIGKDWKAALAAIEWESGELLVVGSSSEGRRSRVFLGTNAARIIRHAPVPVVVMPWLK